MARFLAANAVPLLIPAAILTTLMSLYHASFFSPENCSINDPFSTPFSQNSTIVMKEHGAAVDDYNGPFTIYKRWEHPFPCGPAEKNWKTVQVQRSPSHEGLLYVRELKTGSSTLAGVVLRMAHRKSPTPEVPCKVRIDHSSARVQDYAHRDKSKSFLLSLLRDPTKRAMSHFFHFKVSDQGMTPTDRQFQRFFHNTSSLLSNYYVKDLSMRDRRDVLQEIESGNYSALVQEILDEYNFIAITERMDESLVVLQYLLDLDLGDILHMSAKTQGSFTSSRNIQGRPSCIYIVPSFVTPGMRAFFESDYWKNYIAADMALYRAANASLDKTIDAIGRDIFNKRLHEFQRAKQAAQTACQARTIYRCDKSGKFVGSKNSTCLLWDVGCGYKCLDEFALEWQRQQQQR